MTDTGPGYVLAIPATRPCTRNEGSQGQLLTAHVRIDIGTLEDGVDRLRALQSTGQSRSQLLATLGERRINDREDQATIHPRG